MKRHRVQAVLLVCAFFFLAAGPVSAGYGEAPDLAAQVEAGELLPVEERIPKNPFVVEPVDEVGQYGGTASVAAVEPNWWGDDHMMMSSVATLVQPTMDMTEIVPHVAESYDVNDDHTVFRFQLREGMKWSDGEPLTTEDIRFWYEDILPNEDLTPVVASVWRDGDEIAAIDFIDDYTFEWQFSQPNPLFINDLVHTFGFYPKHYLKQYHPNYVDIEELEAMAEEEGQDSWYNLFQHKDSRVGQVPLTVDRPTLMAYDLVSITSDRRVYERNPYFWKVDSEGNQLPYIDGLTVDIVGDRQVLSGMVISGALDFAGFQSDIRDYPMMRSFEDEGDYRVLLWRSALNEVIYQFNQTHEDEELREIFSDARFRKALSLAIDRDEINEVIYYGQGKPSQFTVLPTSQYYKPEYAASYAEFDPERANELLDEMGLDQRDGEGYRLLPSGERLTFLLEFVDAETPKAANVELVNQHWEEIGIDMNTRIISDGLQRERAGGNLMDASVWHGDGASDVLFPAQANYFMPKSRSWSPINWTLYSDWYLSGGEAGEEPPAHLAELYDTWQEIQVEPDEERRFELAQFLVEQQAENIWQIGTIAEAPFPLVVRNSLRNVAEEGYWAWDNAWITTANPEQMYFAQ